MKQISTIRVIKILISRGCFKASKYEDSFQSQIHTKFNLTLRICNFKCCRLKLKLWRSTLGYIFTALTPFPLPLPSVKVHKNSMSAHRHFSSPERVSPEENQRGRKTPRLMNNTWKQKCLITFRKIREQRDASRSDRFAAQTVGKLAELFMKHRRPLKMSAERRRPNKIFAPFFRLSGSRNTAMLHNSVT